MDNISISTAKAGQAVRSMLTTGAIRSSSSTPISRIRPEWVAGWSCARPPAAR